MGFFAWVRRTRPTAAGQEGTPDDAHSAQDAQSPPGAVGDGRTEGAPVGRPLPGLLGGPDRSAPVQHVPPDVPTPVSRRRLTDWLAEQGHTWFVDSDGDVGGHWRGRLFHLLCLGERGEILQVRGQWNREAAIERLTELLEACNTWNAERLWPKAYVRVRDDGMVHVTCEVATDLEHGTTDDQLGQLLHCGLSSASVFFDELDVHYPDPVAQAP